MSFSILVKNMDTACLGAFGLKSDNVSVTFTPQDGSGTQSIDGVVKTPPMEEEYTPGSSSGTAAMWLFVRFNEITPAPRQGDSLSVNGVDYFVFDLEADRMGGAVLKLRVA